MPEVVDPNPAALMHAALTKAVRTAFDRQIDDAMDMVNRCARRLADLTASGQKDHADLPTSTKAYIVASARIELAESLKRRVIDAMAEVVIASDK